MMDTMGCDVCGRPCVTRDGLQEAVYVIPDERTVCVDCYDEYNADPEGFARKDQESFDRHREAK